VFKLLLRKAVLNELLLSETDFVDEDLNNLPWFEWISCENFFFFFFLYPFVSSLLVCYFRFSGLLITGMYHSS